MITPENLAKITKKGIKEYIFQIIEDNLGPILLILGAGTVFVCAKEYSKTILEIIKNTQ